MIRGDFVFVRCQGHCGTNGNEYGVHVVQEDSYPRPGPGVSERNTTLLERGSSIASFWHGDECLSLFVKEVL